MAEIAKLLDEARRELLDLSARNRLLSVPLGSKSAKLIEADDADSDSLFTLLISEKRPVGFEATVESRKPAPDGDDSEGEHSRPNDPEPPSLESEGEEEDGIPDAAPYQQTGKRSAKRAKIAVRITQEVLQRRLLSLFRDAQTMIEEQGVNILYLALGHLQWFEADNSDVSRWAPLILVPVKLTRTRNVFTMAWTEDEVQENLSLSAKLKAEFGLDLPEFPMEEDLVPSQYAGLVAKVCADKTRWNVQMNAISLGFFSFSKFLMFRDLDPKSWPDPASLISPAIVGLLNDSFVKDSTFFNDDSNLDELIPVDRLDHVVDADGSQSLAIENVRAGRSLVVQGPPGTGKSQSITNILATAVLDGKKVLFVSEKLAALEVVKRRLEASGLGDLCLELHSNKSNKKAVLKEIERTWQVGKPVKGQELEGTVYRLVEARSILNAHSISMHTPIGEAGHTLFRIMGMLARLKQPEKEFLRLDMGLAARWRPEDFSSRLRAVVGLAELSARQGEPGLNPWRGVKNKTVLILDLPEIREIVERLGAEMAKLHSLIAKLTLDLSEPYPESFSDVEELRRRVAHLSETPLLDSGALNSKAWQAGTASIKDVVAKGRAWMQLKSGFKDHFDETALETDLAAVRTSIAAHGNSFFKFLNSKYRESVRVFESILSSTPPKTHIGRLGLLDQILRAQRSRAGFEKVAESGKQAFGTMWRNEESDWQQLEDVVAWVEREKESCVDARFREKITSLANPGAFRGQSTELKDALNRTWGFVEKLVSEIQLDLPTAFGVSSLQEVPISQLSDRVGRWASKIESLIDWNAWDSRSTEVKNLGLAEFVEAIEHSKITTADAEKTFLWNYYSQLYREAVRRNAGLAQFDGEEHTAIVETFRTADIDRLKLAKHRILSKHFEELPSKYAGVGATGLLLAEFQRQRGHRTVRKLLKDAGAVIQAIKPIFMMSPLSVAQFLEPGAVEFDLLVIDEASQVQPVDAFGAFARAKQHVVVGDTKQLPPTRFFSRLTSNDDDTANEDDSETPQAAKAKDMESILGLCAARGLRASMLRWHYRSRHQSLIAVSNKEFYDDRLFIVPSPDQLSSGVGLEFRHVADGVYDRGATTVNRVEARRVCEAIIAHIATRPEFSLGVAAFSIKQQQAILDELELIKDRSPEVERFFASHPHEPFFVKNLENLQGDERDVILISVGYGPDANGYMAMSFGPLSGDGGERRLNVLISRAKRNCVVFASFRADDIDLNRGKGKGVSAFKVFLKFAETGILGIPRQTGGEEMSPFEEQVRKEIEGLGYEVHAQVGVSGFFIDLAVVDPEKPGRYLLGIECDGAAYHSSRSARDRDRLRQAVLEDHGWTIHRIWSTDWFKNSVQQLAKVENALSRAKLNFRDPTSGQVMAETAGQVQIEREAPVEDVWEMTAFPYTEAAFPVPYDTPPHQVATLEMAGIIRKIVEIEGPIHEEEIAVRVKDLWALGRTGARIQGHVSEALQLAIARGFCAIEESCVFIPGIPIKVRDRTSVVSGTLRKPNLLPVLEIREAMVLVVDAHHGATYQETITLVARMFGFLSTSAILREIIMNQISVLGEIGKLIDRDGILMGNKL